MIIYERVFESKIKGMNRTKNGLPCLLDILPVLVCHNFAISVPFQWVLGSLNIFLYLYGIHTHTYIYIPKSLVPSVAIVFFEIDCNVNNAVSIKYNSGTEDCGPRTGYKSVLT